MKRLLCVVLLGCAAAASADEGMWTYDNFPKEAVKSRYGFAPTDAWLKKAMLSSARLAQGCSGSFVSGNGLVMTNHHCAHSCIQQISSAKKDYVKDGFWAPTLKDEVRCPEIEINQLVDIKDVTRDVTSATSRLEGQKRKEAQVAVEARLTHACQTDDSLRCEVVSLYHGGKYHLYKYKRFQDVRLVFAPEFAIAFFGGDPDNFMFPRYDLDVSFLRIYENGRPVATPNHFAWSQGGAKAGDLTFVSGHPGSTQRQLTVAQLEDQRDSVLPDRLLYLAQLRGMLTEYQHRGPEEKRHATASLFSTENSYKALKGRLEALTDKAFFASKVQEERELREAVARDPVLRKKYFGAWDQVARATAQARQMRNTLRYYQGYGFKSRLFGIARALVVGSEEISKPNEKRYPEYSDAALPAVKQHLFSGAPIYPELEIATLTFGLTRMREDLGADDPFVRKVLGRESPEELATRLVRGSKLADLALRRSLWQGGKGAILASSDPMVQMARLIDADSRAVRARYERDIEPVLTKSSELIAQARFALHGTHEYPDATFTLRLSYGQVKGYPENGHDVTPVTTFAGAFDRATGREPFALPQSWLAARSKLNLKTPFDFCSTNDIIGGNSGSPVFNKDLEVVGLVFDGNIQSLGGDYGFDPRINRTVAVESVALTEALSRIYGAQRLVDELRPELARF